MFYFAAISFLVISLWLSKLEGCLLTTRIFSVKLRIIIGIRSTTSRLTSSFYHTCVHYCLSVYSHSASGFFTISLILQTLFLKVLKGANEFHIQIFSSYCSFPCWLCVVWNFVHCVRLRRKAERFLVLATSSYNPIMDKFIKN